MPSSIACSSAPEARLAALWYGSREAPWVLRLASGLFGTAVRLRRAAYRSGWLRTQRIARPVIVVGNLTVGGTGKTPLVIWLAAELRALGRKPGIALRGYGGRRARQPRLVGPDSDPREVGDEAVMLAQRTRAPVVVGHDRALAANRLLLEDVDVVVCDDGLQHLALARDLELAVVDGARGLGNGRLLPAGPLREPAARLAMVDIVVVNEADESSAIVPLPMGPEAGGQGGQGGRCGAICRMRVRGDRLWPLDGARASIDLAALAGRRVHAIAGIGHPERFFATLEAAGLCVIAHAFPDHHRYRRRELAFAEALPLLMTEKDAVKCRTLGLADGWYLPVSATLSESHATGLRERLRTLLAPPAISGG